MKCQCPLSAISGFVWVDPLRPIYANTQTAWCINAGGPGKDCLFRTRWLTPLHFSHAGQFSICDLEELMSTCNCPLQHTIYPAIGDVGCSGGSCSWEWNPLVPSGCTHSQAADTVLRQVRPYGVSASPPNANSLCSMYNAMPGCHRFERHWVNVFQMSDLQCLWPCGVLWWEKNPSHGESTIHVAGVGSIWQMLWRADSWWQAVFRHTNGHEGAWA